MPKTAIPKRELARRMYTFFLTYDDSSGAPSFEKFARQVGMTAPQLQEHRSNAVFDQAYRACLGLRRDYLIDHALTRRFDPSFVKFLLTAEDEQTNGQEKGALDVTVEVIP